MLINSAKPQCILEWNVPGCAFSSSFVKSLGQMGHFYCGEASVNYESKKLLVLLLSSDNSMLCWERWAMFRPRQRLPNVQAGGSAPSQALLLSQIPRVLVQDWVKYVSQSVCRGKNNIFF